MTQGTRWGQRLLFLAIVSGIFLMLPVRTGGPLALDEHVSFWILDDGSPATLWDRSLNYAATPPIGSYWQKAWLTIGGKSELVFRLTSVVPYFFAIVLTYFAGRAAANPVVGGISALLLAWHPDVVHEVRIARYYGLVLLLGAAVVWLTFTWARAGDSWRSAGLWSVASVILIWTHYTAAPLVGLCGLSLLVPPHGGRRPPWSQLLTAAAIVTLAAAGLVPTLLRLRQATPYLSTTVSRFPIVEILGPVWWAGLPIGWLASLAFSGRYSRHPVERRNLYRAAVVGLGPLAVLILVSSLDTQANLASARYRIGAVAGGTVCMAMLLSSRRATIASVAAAAILMVAGWFGNERLPWQLKRIGEPREIGWFEAAKTLAAEAQPGEALFVQGGLAEATLVPAFYDDRTFMDYVSCRLGRFYLDVDLPRFGLPAPHQDRTPWAEVGEIRAAFGKILDDHAGAVWVVGATDTDLNKWSLTAFDRVLREEGYSLQKEWPFSQNVVRQYERTR